MIAQTGTLAGVKIPPWSQSLTKRFWNLDSKELCEKAKRRTGLVDFGDVAFEARLSVLVECLETEADLHSKGRFLARMHLLNILENQLRLTNLWNNLSALEQEPIQRPIFITGMPRSGSTFLHDLFVQNPFNRGPLVWEVMFPPLSPTRTPKEVDQRVRLAARSLWWFQKIAPAASAAHPITAQSPHECVAIHSYTLMSQEFPTIFHLPGYAAFLDRETLVAAYSWQKRFLQYLQLGGPVKQWILKAPDHVFSLDALFKIFPDALIIQMHRNPFEVLRSSLNLITGLREMFAHPQAPAVTARQEARIMAEGVDRITRFRDSHPELSGRFFDVHYDQLVAKPLETVRGLHEQMNLPWNDAGAECVQAMASTRTRYARPQAENRIVEFPLSSPIDAGRFAHYCTRFGVSA